MKQWTQIGLLPFLSTLCKVVLFVNVFEPVIVTIVLLLVESWQLSNVTMFTGTMSTWSFAIWGWNQPIRPNNTRRKRQPRATKDNQRYDRCCKWSIIRCKYANMARVKREKKEPNGSQFDVSMTESHPDGLGVHWDPRTPTYAKQPSASSLFKWCERHFE